MIGSGSIPATYAAPITKLTERKMIHHAFIHPNEWLKRSMSQWRLSRIRVLDRWCSGSSRSALRSSKGSSSWW
jgi:hypothetical protein